MKTANAVKIIGKYGLVRKDGCEHLPAGMAYSADVNGCTVSFLDRRGTAGLFSTHQNPERGRTAYRPDNRWHRTLHNALRVALYRRRSELIASLPAGPGGLAQSAYLDVEIIYEGWGLKPVTFCTVLGSFVKGRDAGLMALAEGYLAGTTPAAVVLDYMAEHGTADVVAALEEVRK